MLADAGDVKDAMAIIKSFKAQPKQQTFNRDSYVVKEEKGVIPYHDYGMADMNATWDGPGTVAQCDVAKLKKICAWFDPENPEVKSSYKLPHHNADLKVVFRGCAAAMGRLNQTDIPETDKKGCYNHIAKHYKDFDKEPPEYGKALGLIDDAYIEAFIDGKRTHGLEAIKALKDYIFDDDNNLDLDDNEIIVDALDAEGDIIVENEEILVSVGDDADE
jgi:hypothetical protein